MAIIRNGDGDGGYPLTVTARNEAKVTARSVPRRQMAALEGDYFIITTDLLSLTATGGDILYFKVEEPSRDFLLDYINYSWNGGSTNFNKLCKISLKMPATVAPTGAYTDVNVVNTNIGSPRTVAVDARKWDGTGNGMTGAVTLGSGGKRIITPGETHKEYDGLFVYSYNSAVILNAVPYGAEAGEIQIEVGFFILDPTVDKLKVV